MAQNKSIIAIIVPCYNEEDSDAGTESAKVNGVLKMKSFNLLPLLYFSPPSESSCRSVSLCEAFSPPCRACLPVPRIFAPYGAEDKSLHHFDKERKMSKSFKVAALVAAAAMFLAAPVFAPRIYAQSSPTGTATAGVFTTDVEDSMDVHFYSGVEFEKWAGFVGIDNTMPSLGYATRFGEGLYLGAWYNGNIVKTGSTVTHSVESAYSLDTQLLTGKITTLEYDSKYTQSNNNLSLLFGVAGMGIKVGFVENLQVWSNPDNTREITQDANGVNKTYNRDYIADDFSNIVGYLVPYLQWGMSLGAGDITIRPKVDLAFGIYRETFILNIKGDNSYEYTTINGDLVGREQINRMNGTIKDFMVPRVIVGASIDLASGASFGIEYGLDIYIYNNSYDGSGFSGTTAGTVEWNSGYTTIDRSMAATTTTTSATLDIHEKTNFEHSITPSFYYSTDAIAEGLSLGFYAEIPVGINVSTDNDIDQTRNTTKTVYNNAINKPLGGRTESLAVTNNGLTETTVFSIGLNASIGASYTVGPRFKVNAGIGLSPCTFTSTTTNFTRASTLTTTTEKTYDADGKLIGNVVTNSGATSDTVTDTVTVENEWKNFSASAAAGFTFNFSDNMAVDMSVYSYGGFNLDLTSVQVLLSFKF